MKTSRDLDYDLLFQEFHAALDEGDWEVCLDREHLLLSMWMGDVLVVGRLTPELLTLGHRISNLGKEDVIR